MNYGHPAAFLDQYVLFCCFNFILFVHLEVGEH